MHNAQYDHSDTVDRYNNAQLRLYALSAPPEQAFAAERRHLTIHRSLFTASAYFPLRREYYPLKIPALGNSEVYHEDHC